jgi:hypothetical protein
MVCVVSVQIGQPDFPFRLSDINNR